MDTNTFVDATWLLPELGHEVEYFTKDRQLKVATYCAPDAYTDKTPMFYGDGSIHPSDEVLCWRYAPRFETIAMAQVIEWMPPHGIKWR